MAEGANERDRLAAAITRQILDVMENGAVNESGERVPPTAAFITAAMKWHERLEKNIPPGQDDDMSQIMAAIRQESSPGSGDIPPLDNESDDAGTR